jgi:hypothetical protein
MRRVITTTLLVAFLAGLTACDDDKFVDLRPQQTALKSQGGRNTCIIFAAVAALEAAYKRAGYGDLDLSEQFTNHMGKTFYLGPNQSAVVALGEDGAETQVGAFGGGGGEAYLRLFARGFRIPTESEMPYDFQPPTTARYPMLASTNWQDPAFRKQRAMSDFNLHADVLPASALHAPAYYGVAEQRSVSAQDPAAIEQALRTGHEVVWDFQGSDTRVSSSRSADNVWTACGPCNQIAHSILLVGFDKRSTDPADHYFIAKNSWGSVGAQEDGFTFVSYDYVRQYGQKAAYIEEVTEPGPWLELAAIGRWQLSFDGWRGELDLYHLPGMSDPWFEDMGFVNVDDRRLGTFYDAAGNAFKVNGQVFFNFVEFYIDSDNPTALWGDLGGKRFSYVLEQSGTDDVMTGSHQDLDGRHYGGLALKEAVGPLPVGADTPRPFSWTSYQYSLWDAWIGADEAVLVVSGYVGSTADERLLAAELYLEEGSWNVTLAVDQEDPKLVTIETPAGEITARHLSWEPGVVAGTMTRGFLSADSFYMERR